VPALLDALVALLPLPAASTSAALRRSSGQGGTTPQGSAPQTAARGWHYLDELRAAGEGEEMRYLHSASAFSRLFVVSLRMSASCL